MNIPNYPFQFDWQPIFIGCSVFCQFHKMHWLSLFVPGGIYFPWSVALTASWTGDSKKANRDCAEGSWAVFTAAQLPACRHNFPGWQHQWVMSATVLHRDLKGTFRKLSSSDSLCGHFQQSLKWITGFFFKEEFFCPLSMISPCPCLSPQNQLCTQVWTSQTCETWRNYRP